LLSSFPPCSAVCLCYGCLLVVYIVFLLCLNIGLVYRLMVLIIVMLRRFINILVKIANYNFWFSCVGRGVLRFWEGWYRKPRSNLCAFCDFRADSGRLGVDIILWMLAGVGELGVDWYMCYWYLGWVALRVLYLLVFVVVLL